MLLIRHIRRSSQVPGLTERFYRDMTESPKPRFTSGPQSPQCPGASVCPFATGVRGSTGARGDRSAKWTYVARGIDSAHSEVVRGTPFQGSDREGRALGVPACAKLPVAPLLLRQT